MAFWFLLNVHYLIWTYTCHCFPRVQYTPRLDASDSPLDVQLIMHRSMSQREDLKASTVRDNGSVLVTWHKLVQTSCFLHYLHARTHVISDQTRCMHVHDYDQRHINSCRPHVHTCSVTKLGACMYANMSEVTQTCAAAAFSTMFICIHVPSVQ